MGSRKRTGTADCIWTADSISPLGRRDEEAEAEAGERAGGALSPLERGETRPPCARGTGPEKDCICRAGRSLGPPG